MFTEMYLGLVDAMLIETIHLYSSDRSAGHESADQ